MIYFFVGIKGAGMSALAQILKELGYEVEGSDKPDHFFTEQPLIDKGIKIYEFNKDNITKNMTIVQGNTYKDDHEEIIKAKELGLKIYSYQEMVSRLTTMFKTITIAGCHGKTTTTSMLAHVFDNIKGCNYLIGDGTGHGSKDNEYFMLEACEYKRHFLSYHPYYAIITNIELDHIDYYKDIDDIVMAYQEYARLAEKMVIACGDDPYTHTLDVNVPIFYYGLNEDNDIIAKEVEFSNDGTSFDVYVEDNYYGHFDLPLYGKHILLNALAVIGICYFENIEKEEVYKYLSTFAGAKRRFKETTIVSSVIIDDYAHHPTEVKSVICAAKQKYLDKKIIVIFQPHTFTRTKKFSKLLADSLNEADVSYVMPIHPARESQIDYPDVTSDLIVDNLENGFNIDIDDAEILNQYDNAVFIFMSPNDISKLEKSLISLKEFSDKGKSL